MRKVFALSMAFCLSFILLTGGQAANAADNSVGKPLEIRLKLGSETIKVNGEAVKVQKPYTVKGVTMVPLSVITRTFGATWKLENQTIILTYNGHTIKLTFDNPKVSVDGKTATLDAAPKVVNGVTMVPLRFISENFGGTISSDAATGEIVIKATLSDAGGGKSSDSGINVDAGKTKIGDSFYKWSMKYPTGLVQGSSSPNNNWISYSEAKGNYTMYIDIYEQNEPLSKEALLKKLANEAEDDEETIVDKRIVDNGGVVYAKVITKGYNGGFAEHRAYYGNHFYYRISFYDEKAKNYKELDKRKDLLDSFKTSFERSDRGLKDLSTVVDGYRKIVNEDYGVTLKVPAAWKVDKDKLFFYDNDQHVEIKVSSIVEGDTLEKWVSRKEKLFLESFKEFYRKVKETNKTTVASTPAIIKKMEYSLGDFWRSVYEIQFIKGKYKYNVQYVFPTYHSDDAEAIFKQIAHSLSVDSTKMEESFGLIEDDLDFVDKSKMVTKTSKKYKYSLDIPVFMDDGSVDMEDTDVEVDYFGGVLKVHAEKSSVVPYEAALISLKKIYKEREPDLHTEMTEETVFGVKATKFVVTATIWGHSKTLTLYVFENNGVTYVVSYSIEDMFSTDENVKRLNDGFNSFKFTK